MFKQTGGGNCSLCGSPNVTKVTCPLNQDSKNPSIDKHPNASNVLAKSTKQPVKSAPAPVAPVSAPVAPIPSVPAPRALKITPSEQLKIVSSPKSLSVTTPTSVGDISKQYAELINLVNTSYDQLKCCAFHYDSEISRLSHKVFHKSYINDLKQIRNLFLSPLLEKYDYVYTVFLLTTTQSNTASNQPTRDKIIETLKLLSAHLPEFVESYVILLHKAFISVPIDLLQLIFPAVHGDTEHFPSLDEKPSICKFAPKLGNINANCIRTTLMQIVSRFAMVGAELHKASKAGVNANQLATDPLYLQIQHFDEVAHVCANILNENERFVDSYLKCTDDFCDNSVCVKLGTTCIPKKPGYSESSWRLADVKLKHK